MGKLIAAFCALAGISFFALPAGILGSGFALKVQQHQRQKHLIRRRVPAATLIQCLWRCYAADPNSSSTATWKIHLRPVRKPTGLTNSASVIERGGFSRLSRFSTLKRRPEKSILSPTSLPTPTSDSIPLDFDEGQTQQQQQQQQRGTLAVQSYPSVIQPKSAPAEVTSPFRTYFGDSPPEQTRRAVHRETSLVRGWFLPEDDDKAMEKIQSVGGQTNTYNSSDLSETRIHRRPVLQRDKTPSFRTKRHMNLRHQTTNDTITSDAAESSHRQDKSPTSVNRQLTEQEKCAVRIIRKMRFLVARRKFREALRPYDVKDVIEQYSAGHLDMLTRVKQLQSRLDQILGRQGGKPEDVYDSHQSLASRIVKIEHKVDAIDVKIDRLVSLCRTDRSGLHHLGTDHPRRLPAPLDTFSHYPHPKCDDHDDQLQPLSETIDSVLHSAKIPDTQTNLPRGFHPAPLVTRFVVPKEQRSESIDTTITEYNNPEASSSVCVEEINPQSETPGHHVLQPCASLPCATQPITASDADGSQPLEAAHGPPRIRMVRSEHQPDVSHSTGETSPSWRSTDCLPRTMYIGAQDRTKTPEPSPTHITPQR